MVHEVSPLILVIKDLDGWVFGAYLSDKLQVKNSFYGSGESFVFTFHVPHLPYTRTRLR
jgi:hypothetical protein